MKKSAWWVFLLLGLLSCNNQPAGSAEKSLEEIRQSTAISNSDIIRHPVSAFQPEDTVNVARITFDEAEFNFGEVKEGEIVRHSFRFTNTGQAPLLINNARSTCGCTVPKWPEEPVLPGESGLIEVRFDTANKKDRQSKPITITANTYPATTRIYLSGYVRASDPVAPSSPD